MSKMDGLRAMREARYAQMTHGKVADSAAVKAPRKAAERPAPQSAGAGPVVADERADEASPLCGHRAISGRTCTREAGHAAKSHRYS
jgi:hypothetical protein